MNVTTAHEKNGDEGGVLSQAIRIGAISALFVVCLLLRQTTVLSQGSHPTFWASHPYSGVKKQWLSWLRATIRSIFGSKVMIDEGYAKFSRSNSIFVMPSIDRGALVVVPPAQLRKIYNLPMSQLDVHLSQNDTVQAKYTVGDPDIIENGFHVTVIRNQIKRNLAFFTPAIAEELELGLDKYWGSSTEWRTVEAWPTILKIVSRAANRVFLGTPYCRDDSLLEDMQRHAEWMFSNATIINATPNFFKPLVGTLVKWDGSRVRATCLRPVMPLIEKRVDEFLQKKREKISDWNAPKDGLQWLIDEGYKLGGLKHLEARSLGHRLMLLNFVSMHTTSLTMTNFLQDLLSSDDALTTIEDLREECSRIFAECQGVWTKAAVEKLHRVDSALRESMRMSPLSVLALPRRVSAPEGIEIDDHVRIPHGIPLATPTDAIHLDETFYADPKRYYAFRFCTRVQIQGTKTAAKYEKLVGEAESMSPKQKSSATLNDAFLSFGFGRHACPGRFYAVLEIKMMLAYIIMNYEIKPFQERPPQKRIMWIQFPREDTKIRLRRKA